MGAQQRQTLIKPAFLQDINRLPARDVRQIMEKVTLLTRDPYVDNRAKKHLIHCPGKPLRLRSGDYRIFYSFNQQYVYIYKIDRRNESTYKECPEPDDMPSIDEIEDLEPARGRMTSFPPPMPPTPSPIPSRPLPAPPSQTANRPLPEPITTALLNRLHIPATYHRSLLQVKDEDALLTCSDVDDKVLLQLLDYLFGRPLLQVMQQPDLILNDVDDLQRYKDGDLLAFLLKLSPDQEKYVNWPLHANGPALVKGGPGTGKSTVALYRVRSLLQKLPGPARGAPRILFTTYTNALIKSSEQLLQQLLDDATFSCVRVYTADTVAEDILRYLGQEKELISSDDLNALLRQAIAEMPLEATLLQQKVRLQTLKRIGHEYLLQEINSILVARQVDSLEAYQHISRVGRKLPLTASQRTIVWRIYERWRELLQVTGKETWQQRRARAETLVAQTPFFASYDAVVIDEAQDLDPSALRMLVKLCKSPDRIFVTADANQSIYGSGFNWADVHEDLRFRGRTSILRTNYRSTRQIDEAAQSYLTSGELESEAVESQYINDGPRPRVLAVQNRAHEAQLLAHFFKSALRSQGLTLGSCAVLCPNKLAGRRIATALKGLNLQATYMTGRDLDLASPGIKVLTLNVSKGLEFPIVALAGFISSDYPAIPAEASPDERSEILARERRTMFVGMTRAMRELLIVVPVAYDTPLLQGFEPAYWNFEREL